MPPDQAIKLVTRISGSSIPTFPMLYVALLFTSISVLILLQIDAFLSDFPQAKSRADELDQQILSQAESISTNYTDLVSFSLRQTLASLEITLPVSTSANTSSVDVLMFMKDMGNSQFV